ncbi:uncharacterized protein RHIMIDRAFT_127923 [Rhizopus microsporus ATCC 52813]|uniref:Uncharacterized protein n=1 Tax=Rhizopus microsporus ATCC 52813 TaxID=1340429 RepID=A0A2G4SW84_RHIZD|nr:uncharacterized protein RHIMIDRAFT_127923 [Rhizopus microsporus ATCC 52813]PHZ13041.1 hypothetical protein RHIMIDRAFT_127923 [Rhizopus microsporus ATCC 52813]
MLKLQLWLSLWDHPLVKLKKKKKAEVIHPGSNAKVFSKTCFFCLRLLLLLYVIALFCGILLFSHELFVQSFSHELLVQSFNNELSSTSLSFHEARKKEKKNIRNHEKKFILFIS